MGWSQGRLASWSRGRAGRASLILIATHLGVLAVAALIWLVGSLEAFDDARWLPIALVTVVTVVGAFGLVALFGFWGTPRTAGRSGGEEYESTFSPGVGFALGWLRWLLQLVAIGGLAYPLVLTWGDAKPWQIFGTAAAGELRERVAAMPVPDGWELRSDERDISASELQRERRRLRFDAPDGYGFEDLRAWITGPEWAEGEDGESFGEIRLEYCDPDALSCHAHAVPDEGEPRIFVYANLNETFSAVRVQVQVTYQEPEDLADKVSEALVARYAEIPIPEEWVSFDASAGVANGPWVRMQHGVPEGFGNADFEAWLDDVDTWADFGELTRQPCEEDDDGVLICGDIKVDAYEYLAGSTTADEFLYVGFDPVIQVVDITLRARD